MDVDIDLAVYHNEPGSSHLEILKNNGSGVFTVTATYAPAILGQDIAGADLDLDGYIDLILTDGWGSQDNVHVMLNNGNGSFTGPTTYSAGTFARGVIAQDVNNDGWPDLVVANNGNDNVTVLLNDGTGHFPTLANYATGAGPNGLFGFDLNHDGWLDLVTTHLGGTAVNVLLNNGAGGFAAPVPYPVGMSQYYITGGDFDGDGDIDLACSGYGTDSCVVLLNSGTGTFPDVARCRLAQHPGALSRLTSTWTAHWTLRRPTTAPTTSRSCSPPVLVSTIPRLPTPNPCSPPSPIPLATSSSSLFPNPRPLAPDPRFPSTTHPAAWSAYLPVPRSLSPRPLSPGLGQPRQLRQSRLPRHLLRLPVQSWFVIRQSSVHQGRPDPVMTDSFLASLAPWRFTRDSPNLLRVFVPLR